MAAGDGLEVDEVAAGDGLEEGVVEGVGISTLVCSATFEAALIAAGPSPITHMAV